jgi:predicted metal-dependent HD superfamily phosphohydrolase
MALYDQPWRKYHGRGHITDVHCHIFHLQQVQGIEPVDYEALDYAVDLHDIIYVPGQPGSEEASALMAASYGLTEAARLIRLTEKHQPEPDDADGILIVNADLFGLGREYEHYRRNTVLIRQEISAYLDRLPGTVLQSERKRRWVAGRSAWLTDFLSRDQIFYGPCMEKYEARARQNMEHELRSYS